MNKLIIYPNCSKGGVTSVIRGRARNERFTNFDVVFFHDRGGRNAFDDLPNVNVRVVSSGRGPNYLCYLGRVKPYAEISVLSHPETANRLSDLDNVSVSYEFHSSDMSIVKKEIKALNLDRLVNILAPSQQMVDLIREELPPRIRTRVRVERNLVDHYLFNKEGSADFFASSRFASDGESVPLVWVGRFDKGKGYQYFIRLIAALPMEFIGHVVVSLESDPQRAAAFWAECESMGVADRIRVYLNLPQAEVADLYRTARELEGWYVSTSLMESFGYSVAEARACGLRVGAFELPGWDIYADADHVERGDPGATCQMLKVIVGR